MDETTRYSVLGGEEAVSIQASLSLKHRKLLSNAASHSTVTHKTTKKGNSSQTWAVKEHSIFKEHLNKQMCFFRHIINLSNRKCDIFHLEETVIHSVLININIKTN